MTGPQTIDMNMDAEFSSTCIDRTSGELAVNTSFSESKVLNHTGPLEVESNFSEVTADALSGSFDVCMDFGKADLELSQLAENSNVYANFGEISVGLHPGAGAEFCVDKNFGGIDFNVDGSLASTGDNCKRRILNGGGPKISLQVNFGSINVRNTGDTYAGTEH